ncbi:hypothetical protein KUA50_004480 [Segatella hominis]|uniref:hypothetical protein n=1 Tax=Segatella hominis TaxID=2518605 RepID=UPI002114942D|nr:hypothetical protein [Segatella hominis]WOZ82227.1 hypothetical protein KUA50_004480 [Segatella hominis]
MMKKNILKCSMGQILRTTVLMILMLCTFGVANGQHRKRPPFNPAKFEADLEQFITVNACLSPSQAASFFPVYRQMMKKQRALFDEMRRLRMINPKDNEACEEAIRKQDELDIQIKQLQQEYHGKFLMMLPANKVLSIIKAEEKFHRQIFRKMK